MKISTTITNCKKTALAFLAVLFSLMIRPGTGFGQTTVFSYTGTVQTYIVPAGVTSVSIQAWGAGGAGSYSVAGSGGSGAFIKGALAVTPGQALTILVGGGGKFSTTAASTGGYGGGGASGGAYGGSGGGPSVVYSTSTLSQATTLVIVGGGGGGGYYSYATYGGGGGATTGSAGGTAATGYTGGTGGTTGAGGAGGLFGGAATVRSNAGTILAGGASPTGYTYAGGGGGGGFFGGGSGYSSNNGTYYSSGGGGGASYSVASLTGVTNTAGTINAGGAATQAPGSTETGYVAGVGNGGASVSGSFGNNGLIIITSAQTITTGTINPLTYCAGISAAAVSVPFTSAGNYTSFTAQLSNAAGSFAAPVNIGTGTVSPINATISAGTVAGTGYRIRVISTTPAVTGTDNGANITINNPAAPTATTPQTFCQIANPTVANLVATPLSGGTVQWYATAAGGTALASTTALTNGTTYYGSQTISSCEGNARVAVSVTVNNPAAPTGTASQPFCQINNPTLASIVTNPTTGIKWYTAATGGTLLPNTTALVNGTTYYASQTVGTCESATRLAVTVTVGNPAAPTGAASQSFCQINNPTLTSIVVTGTAVQWYNAATGGTLLANSTALVNGTTYYASQTVSGCESATRLAVAVTVGNPAAPTGTASQSFCTINNPTVANLAATGTAVQWYSAATGGAALASTTVLVNGTTYYASQTVSGCEGTSRLAVTVTVSNPAPPTGAATQSFCSDANPTVANLAATGTAIQWYSAATGGTPLAGGTALVDGTHYYASQTIGSCESATRLDVTATIYQPPVITGNPGPASTTLCTNGTINYTVTATGSNLTYQWLFNGSPISNGGDFSGATTATLSITGADPTDGGNYSVIVSGSSPCTSVTSTPVSLTVDQNIGFSPQPAPSTTLCMGQTFTISTTVSGTVTISQWYKNGAPYTAVPGSVSGNVYTLSIPGITVADAGSYKLFVDDGTGSGCPSAFSGIAVLNVNTSTTTTDPLASQTVCQNAASTNLSVTASGTGPFTYQWFSNAANNNTTGTIITGAITSTYTPPTTTAATTYYYVVVTGTCNSVTSATAMVTVTPIASIAAKTATTCSTTGFTVTPLNGTDIVPAGTTYSWGAPTVTGGLTGGAAGTNATSITGTLTNPTNTNQTATYTVTPTSGSCPGATFTVTVTVNPKPSVTAQTATTCSATGFTVTPANGGGNIIPTGTTYSWSAPAVTGGLTGGAAGTNAANISGALTNPTNTAQTATYTVTPASGTCTGSTFTVTVTVNPQPAIANKTATACSATGFTVTPVNGADIVPAGTTYSWSAPTVTGGVTGGAAGTNAASITGTLNNPTNTAQTATYTVTPTSGTCAGSTFNVTVTVNPKATIAAKTQTICSGGSFTVTPANGTDIVPAGTTYSWSAPAVTGGITGGAAGVNATSITGTLNNPTNTTQTATYTVTPSSGTCTGATFTVTVTVSPQPAIANKTATTCSATGFTVTPVNGADVVPAGTTYSWSIPTVTGGLTGGAAGTNATSITGTLTNPTNTAQTATYTVTPASGTCTGSTFTVIVTVNPKASITAKTATTCGSTGFSVTPVDGSGGDIIPAGTTYSWSAPAVTGGLTGGASGTNATSITGTLANPTNTAQTATYTVTPTSGTCAGATFTVIVTVNPKPSVTAQTTATCSGTAFSVTPTNGGGNIVPAGTTYSWSAPTVTGGVTGGAAGTNAASITGTLNNPTNTTQTATYTVTPTSGTCTGSTFTVTVTVAGIINYGIVTAGNEAQCTPANPSTINFSTAPAGGNGTFTYQWYYQDGLVNCPTGTSTAGWTVITGATGNSYNPPAGLTNSRTYAVVVTPGACGVATWASNCRQVTVNPLPTAGAITGTKNTVCIGSQITLNSNASGPAPLSYSWSSSNTGVGTVTNAGVVTGIGTGTTNITYTVTDGNGCSSTSTNYQVTVTRPTAGAITQASGLTSVCVNSTLQLTSNATGTGTLTYTWSSSNTAIATVSNTGLVTGVAAGSANITYTVTDGNGCSRTSPAYAVTVLAVPSGTLTATENSGTNANDNIICAGDAVTFTAPSGYGSYVFKVNGTIVQGPNTDNTYSTTTLITGQTVTVDIANANNCGATFTAPAITVNPLPAATLTVTESSGATNDNTICPNAPVTLTGGAGGTSYSFLINGTAVSTGASNTFTTTSIASTSTVAVTVTNANGCQATSANQTITVVSVPAGTLAVSPSNSFCTGTSVTFTATATAPTTGYTYNFKVNGVSKQNNVANTYTTNTLTNGQVVTVDVINSNGCTTTFNPISVTVNPLPTGTLTATENSGAQNDNTICAGSPVTFTATSGYSNYAFYLKGTGTALYNGPSNVYTTSTLVNNDYLTVVVTSGSSCTATFTSSTITVVASPTGTLTPSMNPICAGSSETFTATAGYTNYNFQVNGTTVQNGSSNTYNTTTLAPGDAVTVDVTGSNGCTSTFTATVTINPMPTGTLAIAENSGTANDGTICTGTSVTFTAPNGFTNYNFLLNGSSVQSGASITYTTTTLADNDKVTVAVTGAGGCIGLLNQYTITVNPLPAVAPITTTAPSFDVCVGSTITLQDATNTGGTFTWISENTGIATVNVTTGVVTGVTAGAAIVDYTFTNANGCSTTVTATVTVHALPVVQPITGNFNICTGTNSQLNDVITGGTWSSNNTGVATVDNTGLVHGAAPGTATISYAVTDIYGCTTTVTADVTVSDFPTVAPITTTSPSSFNVCLSSMLQLNDATTGGTWSIVNVTGTATITASGLVTGTAAGTVTAYYSINSSCGLPAFAMQNINVNTPPSAGISYTGNPFCTSSGTVSVTQTGTTGGTYSSTSGLTINTSNGDITPATSTAGTYTVTYTIPATATGGCGVYTTTTSVIITQAPSAIISYAGSPYCSSGGTASVTRTGTAGGTYTKSTGAGSLSINSATGDITLGTSTPGTYTVTYTVAASGGCAAFSTTASVTITAAPAATISYTGNPFCKTSGTVNPTLTGTTGGTYNSTAGLTINSTGTITPATSTAGTYTVTYTVAASGGCSVYNATTLVTITAAPTAVAGTAVVTCSNNPPVNITAGSSATNYSTILWSSSGTGTFVNANSLTTATYTPSAADISAGSVTLTLTANGNAGCTAAATSTKTLTISAPPAAFVLTPSGTINVCQGNVQPLIATANNSSTGSTTISSGNINLAIPDATLFGLIPGSVTNNLAVSTIPAGAVINSMSVNFNITHTYDGDLVLNLKAANGKVLNLVDRKGKSGDNFTNTIVSSTGTNPFLNNASNAPFTGIFVADGDNGVGTPNSGNTVFSDLFSTPNGTWTFGAEDDAVGDVGTILNWSITFNYTVPNAPLSVTWSPVTDLFTDASATTTYTGTPLSTIYAKPSSPGTKVYSATVSNAAGCSTSQNVTLNVGSIPVVTVVADYCAVAGKVKLTATSTPAATSYLWNTGETTQTILVDVSGIYSVTVYAAGSTCPGKGTINVANELVTNGNFELGNVGFTSSYPYRTGAGSLNNPPGYAVDTAANYYGPSFLWGKDHTTTHGKFMMVNGTAGANYQIWQETFNVLPNTAYYFSAWGLELDDLPGPPTPANAQLQFNINGTQVGTLGNLPRPANNLTSDTANHQWVRFYGTWTSGPTTTSVIVSITDLQGAVYGNNFGLDDISFSTLSTFVDLQSAPGTDAQTICANNAIQNIVYSAGSSASAPTVTPLPSGVTSSWNGVYLTISGTPTVAGNYSYTITTTGSCQPASASGTITVQAQKIALSSGSSSPSLCANVPMANIVFTLSGTATGATTTGLPAGVTGTLSGTGPTYTYTISGTPTAAAGSYPYTITTLGTCSPVTFNGTITITSQTITLNSANNTQTVCINSPIANIQYTIGGTGTNASVVGLPTGVTGSYNSGLFVISGSPTQSGTFNYTVTTSGTSCAVATVTGTIMVTPGASFTLTSGVATNPQTVCKGSAINNVTFSVSNATGASATGLPAGVTGAYTGGVFTISGAPTAVAGVYNYTITSSGGCAVGTTTGSITIQAQTISLTSGTASPSVCANTPIMNIVYTIGGTATGAMVTGLPAGVTGVLSGNTFTIGGTPTAAPGAYAYTVTTSGTCTVVTATGTITIQAAATGGTIASVSICSGSSGTLTLTGQIGAVTRWEVSTDFGTTWTQIANTTISQSFNNVTTTTMYRVLISGCGTVYSSVATVGVHNLWTGRTSTDWNITSNWSDNLLPSASCTTVMIPSGTPNKPVLTSNVIVPNLTIASGTSVDLNGNSLEIDGTFTGSSTGAIKTNALSGLVIGGNTSTLFFDATNNTLKTLIVNSSGSATLGNALNITGGTGGTFGSTSGVVTVNGTLNTGGNLTLQSNQYGDAVVGQSTGTPILSGNVTVERFIPKKRAWRFLAVPTNSAQTIKAAWQEGGQNPDLNYTNHQDFKPGYGTQITYDNLAAHGFDDNTTTNPSIKVWNVNTNDWSTTIPYTVNPISNFPAYCLFVRGSRDIDLSLAVSAGTDNTTLRTIGGLNYGTVTKTYSTQVGNGVLIANPYASPIDILSMLSGNGSTFSPQQFAIWDPKYAGNYGDGGYRYYANGWVAPNDPGGYTGGTYAQSGQAFMLTAQTTGNVNVNFKEGDKVAPTTGEAVVFDKLTSQNHPAIYANLMSGNGSSATFVDGVTEGFGKDFSAKVDVNDAQKFANFDENMVLLRNEAYLSIELRPIPVLTDTFFYRLYLRQQPYTLQIFGKDLADMPGQAWLVDKYLNTKTSVNLNDTTLYSFTPNTDLGSYRDRFMLVFKRTFKATPVATTMSLGGATASTLEGKVDVYPNPVVTGGKVLLKFNNMKAGNYEITLSSLGGKALTKKSIQHEGGDYNYDLLLDVQWATGNYLITITGKNGYSTTTKLVIGK